MTPLIKYKYVKYDTGNGYIREGLEPHPEGEWMKAADVEAREREIWAGLKVTNKQLRAALASVEPAVTREEAQLKTAITYLIWLGELHDLSSEQEAQP